MLRLVANLVWLVLCGAWTALAYAVLGVLFFVLVVTIPFGIASMRLAAFALWPFGRDVVPRVDAGAGSFVGNVAWFVVAGLWLGIGHVVAGVLLCLTVIGIPLGVGQFKLAVAAANPLGKVIVPRAAFGPGVPRSQPLPPAYPPPPSYPPPSHQPPPSQRPTAVLPPTVLPVSTRPLPAPVTRPLQPVPEPATRPLPTRHYRAS